MWSSDYVCVELTPGEMIYFTIMGQLGDCIGISIYEGESGYEDLGSISRDYDDSSIEKYIMYEQRCLTFYMGDRSEVPKNQLAIIKELGLKYRGHNAWPYFLSFEPQYYPFSIDDQEAKRMVDILEVLYDVLKAYCEDKIDVDYEKNEMIYAHKDNKEWVYEAMSFPQAYDKFSVIELQDEKIYKDIKSKPQSQQDIYLDLFYMNTYIEDKKYKKPINSLVLIVVDKESEMIMHGQLLSPNDDQINTILSFFIPYILNTGKSHCVYVRNPRVYSAIFDICSKCGIHMDKDNFRAVDVVIDEMMERM